MLILSPDAFKSLATPESWVAREVGEALKTRQRIIIIRVGVPPLGKEGIPAEFAELAEKHSIEFQSGHYFGPMMEQVLLALRAK
jgi:hypothetical protein